jgi:Uncharacterized protein conserved in bacteria (DUF2213)
MSTQYHSLMLSPNMSTTAEGYLICHNVPICRSGFQDYYGKELKDFPGYKDSWHLDPERKYAVYRPPHEVVHRDTIRSFEGKTLCDEHPDGDVVTVDNEHKVNRGHIQNVKQGPDFDGQVTLQGDFVIKDSDLIEKIRPRGDPESGIREVSCGYTLKLRRRSDGVLEMYNIRGNHVAVVEKGRAGPRIAILDAAPPEIIKHRKDKPMSIRQMISGLGLKAFAETASPEELARLVEEPSSLSPPGVAIDSRPRETLVSVTPPPVEIHRQAAHAALDRAMDAMKDPNGNGTNAFGQKVGINDLRAEVSHYIGLDAASDASIGTLPKGGGKQVQPGETASDDDDDDDDDDKHMKPGCDDDKGVAVLKGVKDAADDDDDDDDDDRRGKGASDDDDDDDDDDTAKDASPRELKSEKERLHESAADEVEEAIKIDKKGESVLKALNDSVRGYFKISRPVIAAIANKPKKNRTPQEQTMIDGYNRAVKHINRANGQAYAVLTKTKIPSGIPALATDSSKETSLEESIKISRFYEGVPYRVGKQKHEAYLAQKGS